MDSYDVEITETAKKELKRFNPAILQHFSKKIEKIRQDPKAFGKPLRSDYFGIWEYYFEKRFRILFKIDETRKTIIIIGIKHKDWF